VVRKFLKKIAYTNVLFIFAYTIVNLGYGYWVFIKKI